MPKRKIRRKAIKAKLQKVLGFRNPHMVKGGFNSAAIREKVKEAKIRKALRLLGITV